MGVWDFAWSIVSYISIAQLGIGTSLNRYVSKFRAEYNVERLSVAVSTTAALQIALAALALLATAIVAVVLPYFLDHRFGEHSDEVTGLLFFLGASIAVSLALDTSRGVLTGCHRWALFSTINSSTQIVSSLLMILVLIFGGSLVELAITYCVMAFIQGAIRTVAARLVCPEAAYGLRFIEFKFARELLVYGVRSVAIAVPSLVVTQGMYVATTSFIGPSALAILVRPVTLMRYIESFITRFTFQLTPMAESIYLLEGKLRLQELALASSRTAYALTLPASMSLLIFGDEVIRMWMGSDYVNNTVITLTALIGCLASFDVALVRIVVGLDLHGRGAIRAILLTLVLASSFLLYGYWVHGFTLEYFAFAIFASSLGVSIYLWFYCCGVLGLRRRTYVQLLLGPPTPHVLLTSIVAFGLDAYYGFTGATTVIAITVYGLVVVGIYYRYLLPYTLRKRVGALIRPGRLAGAE